MTVATRRPTSDRRDRPARPPRRRRGDRRATAGRPRAGARRRVARDLTRDAAGRAPPPARLAEPLARPGPAPHRRGQAALAVGRPDRRRGRRPRRPRPRLPGAAARRPSRVLCEPHWFGGSVADLAAVRAAVVGAGPGQGVRRRPAAARRCSGAAGRRRCPAPRRPASRATPRRSRRPGARPRARAARRGPRRARARPRPRDACPRHRASTTATCERSTSTRSGPSGCASSCPDDRLVDRRVRRPRAVDGRRLAGASASTAPSSARR